MNRKRTIQKGELRNVEVELVSLLYACDHFAKHGLMGRNDVNHNMHPVPELM